jgi:hypothetical protein
VQLTLRLVSKTWAWTTGAVSLPYELFVQAFSLPLCSSAQTMHGFYRPASPSRRLHQVSYSPCWSDFFRLETSVFSGSSSSSGGEIKRALWVGRTCKALSDVVHRRHFPSCPPPTLSFSLCCRESAAGRIPITLGGDHSIAVGTLQGILRAQPSSVIFWIDAHAGARAAGSCSCFRSCNRCAQTSTRLPRRHRVRCSCASSMFICNTHVLQETRTACRSPSSLDSLTPPQCALHSYVLVAVRWCALRCPTPGPSSSAPDLTLRADLGLNGCSRCFRRLVSCAPPVL